MDAYARNYRLRLTYKTVAHLQAPAGYPGRCSPRLLLLTYPLLLTYLLLLPRTHELYGYTGGLCSLHPRPILLHPPCGVYHEEGKGRKEGKECPGREGYLTQFGTFWDCQTAPSYLRRSLYTQVRRYSHTPAG